MNMIQRLDEIKARCIEHETLFGHPPPFAPEATVRKYREFIVYACDNLPELEQALRKAHEIISMVRDVGGKMKNVPVPEAEEWLEKWDKSDSCSNS